MASRTIREQASRLLNEKVKLRKPDGSMATIPLLLLTMPHNLSPELQAEVVRQYQEAK